MRRLLNWFKSFKGGFKPQIELRVFGIIQIFVGYYSGEDDYFLKADGCNTPDLTAVSFNIWKFGVEVVLNKTQE